MKIVHLFRDRSSTGVFATGQPTIGPTHKVATFNIQGLSFPERLSVQTNRFNDLVVSASCHGELSTRVPLPERKITSS